MRYIEDFSKFLQHVYENKTLLFTLVKNNFKKQYLGSYLGLFWAFMQPLTFIGVIWFVFEIGFRVAPTTDGTPFFLYLISGIIPWFFISDALIAGTESIINNSFMVKKVAFRVSILPLVEIGSALMIHLVLLGVLIVTFLIYGYMPTIYWLQLPLYILLSILLVLGISWFSASIRVFVKDTGNVITVLMQLGFWATPIFWSMDMIPEKYQWILKLNPAFYIVDGYRNTFIKGLWFWENQNITLYYFGLTFFCLFVGAIVFRKLRPHFGDVL